MERVVKFRGKVVNHDPMTNPENGWVEGYYLQDLDNREVKHYIFNCPCRWEVVPESVGQFTGLHDKNGNEIYEGDVITQYLVLPNYRNARRGQVLFDKLWCFVLLSKGRLYHLFGDGLTQEVQGNIHDNPNLLTNGKD